MSQDHAEHGLIAFDGITRYGTEGQREWVERRDALLRYTRMPRGGHFAAFEEPGLLADDIAAFFATLD